MSAFDQVQQERIEAFVEAVCRHDWPAAAGWVDLCVYFEEERRARDPFHLMGGGEDSN